MRRSLLVPLVLAAACVPPQQTRTGVGTDAFTLERRAERVFAQMMIPVRERDLDGRVQSGWFVASERWDPATLTQRVDCGMEPDGRPRAARDRVELTVTLQVHPQGSGTGVTVSSDGRTAPRSELEAPHRCVLRDPFVRQLMAAVTDGRVVTRPGR